MVQHDSYMPTHIEKVLAGVVQHCSRLYFHWDLRLESPTYEQAFPPRQFPEDGHRQFVFDCTEHKFLQLHMLQLVGLQINPFQNWGEVMLAEVGHLD